MKYFIACVLLIVTFSSFAQPIGDEDIADSVIGWWANSRYDHLKPQTEPLNKRKEALTAKMVEWMKASYTPVAGLGTSSRYINKVGYGVNFAIWNVSHDKQWTDEKGRFVPIAEENYQFSMAANKMFGAFPIYFMNKPGAFYFTLQPDGYASSTDMMEMRRGTDKRIHPNAYKHITWINDWCTVYLTPDNQLPFIPVSKGELLQQADEALARQYDGAPEYTQRDIVKYRGFIKQLSERYRSTLNDPAVIRHMQPTMYSFELDPDIFDVRGSAELMHAFPVYKLNPVKMAKMGSDTPQWIAVAWPFETRERGNRLFEMFTSMAQNVNYDYISDYFFHPEKVKGIPYTAANEAQLKARLEGYKKGTVQKKQTLAKKLAVQPSNRFLFDDFSQEAIGGKPVGWLFSDFGKAYTVSTVKGQNGNWLKMGNSQLSSATLKKFPEHFTLEFDVLTSVFDGRTGAEIGLELSGSKKGADGTVYTSSLEIAIVSGNQEALLAGSNYRGEIRVKLFNRPSQMPNNERGGYFTAPLPTFTNTQSRAHIKLVRKDDGIEVWVNNIRTASSTNFKTMYGKPCGDCSIRPGIEYSKFTFENRTQEADVVNAYLGNISITKE